MSSDEEPLRLSEDEARTFLALLDKVEADMEDGFEEAAAQAFGDEKQSAEGVIVDEWGDGVGSLYTTVTRRKMRRFVEQVYFDDEE